MASTFNEPLDKILNNYGIKVLSIRNESYKSKKGVWWVETPEGFKILKKVSFSEDTLNHILHAIRHLTSNGILIPRVIKTLDNIDYVKIDEVCYVLSEAINGKNPSYNSPDQLALVIKELAKFHKASDGFSPLPKSKPKIHLGTWIDDYERQIEDMSNFFEYENIESANEIGKIIKKEFPYFRERAHLALNGLKGPEYKEWVEKIKKNGCLCHQDFAAGNLIMSTSQKLYVLDTDSITIDIPCRDIRKILNKIMKKKGSWDEELTKKVLGYYQSVNYLTTQEWQVVMYDLMFPHLFLGAMNKYYYKREKEWKPENYLKRIKETIVIEKSILPILERFKYILPI